MGTTFDLAQDYTLEVRDYNEFTYDWAGWSDPALYDPAVEDAVTKRKEIKKKLDLYNFSICPSKLNKDIIFDVAGGSPDEVETIAISDGITLVRVHYDESDQDDEVDTLTGKIEQGKPVCFDMVTGKAVTGIPSSWGIDEYKIVGTALVDWEQPTTPGDCTYRIPIKLSSISPATGNTQFLVSPQFTLNGRRTNQHGEEEVFFQDCPKAVLENRGEFSQTPQDPEDYWRWVLYIPDQTDTLLVYNPSTRDIRAYSYVLVQEDGENGGKYRAIGEYAH